MEFGVVKQSNRSAARLGVLKTAHGSIQTPALVPVATQAVVKTLTSQQVLETNTQLLICNTFHLHLKPGERVVRAAGGLHHFMHWPKPLMTDSGGFQVFSLGFGRDFQVGKIAPRSRLKVIPAGTQPQSVKITDSGVWWRSPLDGARLFIGPKESMIIQQRLGADITFAFDECPPPHSGLAYARRSLVRTHTWAEVCLNHQNAKQALFGIVQGGKYRQLRVVSARFIGQRPFDGFGIGGEFGSNQRTMLEMLAWTMAELPADKPRHLLGIGHPEDIPAIIKAGVDTFDCIAPTHYARHGTAFTSAGKLDLKKSAWLKDQRPLDPACGCNVCAQYTRSYIAHLLRAKEITGLVLLTIHNLFFFNALVERCRTMIKQGKL